ncbi:MAG: hypothetical protein JOZ43_01525 [Acidobacteriales bacterium]|nr:hypothetical protein [Terriglobales bacterium]
MSLKYVEPVVGALLMLLFLADVFLTVLYARIGTGIFSTVLARSLWRSFRGVARRFGQRRGKVLSFCGPVILVALVLFWALGLTLGTALIIHPGLGKSVLSSNGSTPQDFVSAIYAGGSSLSIVGAGNFSPKTGGMRMFYLLNSLIGMSVISLTLTYLMQVYSALHQRNALGLKLHLLSAETSDAAQFIARLGPQGDFDSANSTLFELGGQLASVKEAHHFYPVLFYFRFSEAYYSVSRITLMALDTVALLRSALDANRYAALQRSAALTQMDRASLMLLTTLEEEFLAHGAPQPARPDVDEEARWRSRYLSAEDVLRSAGIQVGPASKAGAERYVSLRSRWSAYIEALAPAMLFEMSDVDPALRGSTSGDFTPLHREGRLAS